MILYDFYADWCGPCRRMAPIIEQLAAKYPTLTIAKIDIETEPYSHIYDVRSIPQFVLWDDDAKKVIAAAVGAMTLTELETALALTSSVAP